MYYIPSMNDYAVQVVCHVSLSYPPARLYDLDFLDSFRSPVSHTFNLWPGLTGKKNNFFDMVLFPFAKKTSPGIFFTQKKK